MRSLFLLFLFFFGGTQVACAQQPQDVSMVQLLANPDQFDGKIVRVIGYLHLEFEGDAIYLHQEDFRRAILKNGISIDIPASQSKSLPKLNNRYVLVEGTFSANTGHLGIWSGSLQQVNRLSDWSTDRSREIQGRR